MPSSDGGGKARETWLCTLPDAAERVGVEYRTLHSWMTRGLIKPTCPANGAGRPAGLTLNDLALVAMLARLRRAGCGMEVLQDVAEGWTGAVDSLMLSRGEGVAITVQVSGGSDA